MVPRNWDLTNARQISQSFSVVLVNYDCVCRPRSVESALFCPYMGSGAQTLEVIRLMRPGKNVCHIILVKTVTQLFPVDCPMSVGT